MHDQAAPPSPALPPPLLSAAAGNMLLAAFAFSIMNIFVKQLDRIPVMEIVFMRCLVSALFCGVGLWRVRGGLGGEQPRALSRARHLRHDRALRVFRHRAHMPLATAVTIQYLSPIFTAFIGVFVLGKMCGRCSGSSTARVRGRVCAQGLRRGCVDVLSAAGNFSALFASVAYNLARRLREQEHPLVVVLHFQLVGV